MRAKLLHFILRGHNSYENSYCRQDLQHGGKQGQRKIVIIFVQKCHHTKDGGHQTEDGGSTAT